MNTREIRQHSVFSARTWVYSEEGISLLSNTFVVSLTVGACCKVFGTFPLVFKCFFSFSALYEYHIDKSEGNYELNWAD